MVPKKDKSWHLCVDFKDLNKACPKDPFPLPRIDQIIDATAGHDSLCFLDAYSGYRQIKIAEPDQAATAFITPYGPFCFNTMPFGLKNAGATYQRMIQTCLANQIGKTVEAYVDDVVVKTKHVETLVDELRLTFDNLRTHDIKLYPENAFSAYQQESSWDSLSPVEVLKPIRPKFEHCHSWLPQQTSNKYKN